tara:strand:- start:42 stop:746 length:705 start_codon:yes stop_codon:yes gene_type:complete
MGYDDILHGMEEWNNLKEGKWESWDLPNIPILRSRLPKSAIDFVWKKIEEAQEDYQSMKKNLVGNITESLELEDTDDYFFRHILKDTAEKYVETFPTGCSKNPFSDHKINGLYMKSFWVNFSKQHEFNPVHDHNGVLSFVLWMKIPTKWQEQHELPISSDSSLPCASNFQFFYNDIFGSTRGVVVEMDPMMEGCILMFPSILQHQVYPFYNSDGYRISISGNLCFDPKIFKDML